MAQPLFSVTDSIGSLDKNNQKYFPPFLGEVAPKGLVFGTQVLLDAPPPPTYNRNYYCRVHTYLRKRSSLFVFSFGSRFYKEKRVFFF